MSWRSFFIGGIENISRGGLLHPSTMLRVFNQADLRLGFSRLDTEILGGIKRDPPGPQFGGTHWGPLATDIG